MQTYIAIDIGASSGRLIKSQLVDGKIQMEEVYRFKNGFDFVEGHDRWNIDELVTEILKGLSLVKQQGIVSCHVGIDTWAVDYCLLDKGNRLISQPIAYRDERTSGAIARFQEKMSLEELYEKTGVQIQPFNTLFQLLVEDTARLQQAKSLLLIPDYLGYVFTGKSVMEKTNASTMQLLNWRTQQWDSELLSLAGVTEELLPPLVDTGNQLGHLVRENFPMYDLPNAIFVNVASHDTASAVLGTPGENQDWAYISSGTWSLLGIESQQPFVSSDTLAANYTNEGGAYGTVRFLKNIMGMWLIQEVARMQGYAYSYADLSELAATVQPFQQFIDINDARFLNPANMIEELQAYCRETQQRVPKTPAELARCVYDNLALCYASELKQLSQLTGQPLRKLHIVGGGSNNQLLNQLTATVAQIVVEAGPSEATAIGNIVAQMISSHELSDLVTARHVIQRSFASTSYQPGPIEPNILENYQQTIENYQRKWGTI